jgi:thymidine phosphorylase
MNHVTGLTRELWTPEPHRDREVPQVIVLARAWTAAASPALVWDTTRVADRLGLDRTPGHRTTPIVAAIVAAAGATMPHFSLRSGTEAWSSADAMATLTVVELDRATAVSITSRVGACIARADAVHAASWQCLTAVTEELRRAPLISVDDASTAAPAGPQDMH